LWPEIAQFSRDFRGKLELLIFLCHFEIEGVSNTSSGNLWGISYWILKPIISEKNKK
jgi:hypothetical protein